MNEGAASDPILDAHVHVWDLAATPQPWITPAAAPAIARDFALEDLHSAAAHTGVSRVLLVQSANDERETADLLRLASGDAFVGGVVGWTDLAADDAEFAIELLRRRQDGDWLCGFRHVFQEGQAADWLLASSVNGSLELLGRTGLSFDLLLSSTELDSALQVAQRHPGVTFVLDHLAKPNVRDGFREPWRERLVELGRVGNVYAKISGLPAEADWTSWSAETLRPYFEIALEAFGSERLIFATDWPVCTVAGGYGTIAEAQLDFVKQLSPHEQRAVLWDNGCRAYRLTPPQPDPRHHVESAVRNRANRDD